VPIDKAV